MNVELLKKLQFEDGPKFEDTIQYDELADDLRFLKLIKPLVRERFETGSYIEPDNLCVMIMGRNGFVTAWEPLTEEDYKFMYNYLEKVKNEK